jgi:monoamine oxidase
MRSPLLAVLRDLLADADPPGTISRRSLLKTALGAAAMPPLLTAAQAAPPRIAIVGAGITGLYCAWILKRAGLASTVYEAAARTGGRMYSTTGGILPELTTELGGEFIDSNHAQILGLSRHFGFELIDTKGPGETGVEPEQFFFGGALRKPAEIVDPFRELSPRLARDARRAQRNAAAFDDLSIDEYLTNLGVTGWLRSLLQVAFRTEYGMDTGEQSARNLLTLIEPEVHGGRIHLFGESDERYKIRGGNQKICAALAADLGESVRLGHRLEAVLPRGDGYRLAFRAAASPVEVDADTVVLTVPFTILRNLDIRVPLSKGKRAAIRDLGYGTNAKVFFGFERRLWRERGASGTVFTDGNAQLVWDSSRSQPGTPGTLTMLLGGAAGIASGNGTAEGQERLLLPELERIWPGLSVLRSGPPQRFHWPTHPYTLGAYASYRVGQWRAVRGREFAPEGRLYFAGEHCSLTAQGYMEGGAETGRRVAEMILRQAGRRV